MKGRAQAMTHLILFLPALSAISNFNHSIGGPTLSITKSTAFWFGGGATNSFEGSILKCRPPMTPVMSLLFRLEVLSLIHE